MKKGLPEISVRKNIFFLLVFFSCPIVFPIHLFAASPETTELRWGTIFMGLLGGMAFFLYGMEKMSDGMKKTAGNKIRGILAALTKNRVVALLVGAFVTMVIQSSSATTVMLVSFVNAQLMTFAQTIGVLLGAGIGTTITAQLIAFKLTDYALIMIVVGFCLQMLAKNEQTRNIGDVILGFGILFYGMYLMSESMKPLRSYPEFIDLLKQLETPILGIVFGTLFTAVIQSSSAFIGVVIVLAQQHLITLNAGIPLIFGANIGTCITAVIASINASREAKRVAFGHVLFRVAGVLLFVFWIPEFTNFIHAMGTHFKFDVGRDIANAHTIFNVGAALVFLPFTTAFASLVSRMIPVAERAKGTLPSIWHIDEKCITTPALAIDLARAEISRMAKLLGRMIRAIIIPFISDERMINEEEMEKEEMELFLKEIPKRDEIFPELSLLEGIDMREEKIDFLEEKINDYLVQIARQNLSDEQAGEVYAMMSIVKDMESMGDIIHRNMVPLISKKKTLKMDFSKEGKEELMIYHNKVHKQIQLLQEAFAERDPVKARTIMAKERKYLDLESQYRVLHLERILCKRRESMETHEIHMELMDLMKQVIVYSSNIAKTFLADRDRKPADRYRNLGVPVQ